MFDIRLKQLQILVVEKCGRTAVDFEPVGTNEILLIENRVVWAHEFEISHLYEENVVNLCQGKERTWRIVIQVHDTLSAWKTKNKRETFPRRTARQRDRV